MRSRPFTANRQQFLAALRKRFRNLLFGLLKMPSGFRDRVTFDQNIFPAEFIVRIASFRRVSMRLHAVMEIENLSGIAKRWSSTFFLCPNVESAFGGLLWPLGSARAFAVGYGGQAARGYNWAVCIFGGEKAAVLRCHVAGDIIENVARDDSYCRSLVI